MFNENKRVTLRYSFLTITGKLRCSVRASFDAKKAEYHSSNDYGVTHSLSLNPCIDISIVRPMFAEDGTKIQSFNRNDFISLTSYTLPLFIHELYLINESLQRPNLYVEVQDGTNTRLDLNPQLAKEHSRVLQLNEQKYILFEPIVIEENSKRSKGIKITFNTEPSSVMLNMHDLFILYSKLDKIDMDAIVLSLFKLYAKHGISEVSEPINYKDPNF